MFRRLRPVALASAAFFAFLGCAEKPKEQSRAQVSGTVTLEKQPLKTGKILFDPRDGTPPATLDILDGKYEGLVPVGKTNVRLNSFVKVSMKEKMKMDGPGYDAPSEENILPARYNTKSEVTREVVAGGPNVFNFDLEKK